MITTIDTHKFFEALVGILEQHAREGADVGDCIKHGNPGPVLCRAVLDAFATPGVQVEKEKA